MLKRRVAPKNAPVKKVDNKRTPERTAKNRLCTGKFTGKQTNILAATSASFINKSVSFPDEDASFPEEDTGYVMEIPQVRPKDTSKTVESNKDEEMALMRSQMVKLLEENENLRRRNVTPAEISKKVADEAVKPVVDPKSRMDASDYKYENHHRDENAGAWDLNSRARAFGYHPAMDVERLLQEERTRAVIYQQRRELQQQQQDLNYYKAFNYIRYGGQGGK